ncbi:MAG TPA: hypothetical protein VFT50_09045 [Baekduia sp.]|nr:hypothetical protein [Baekduia sp.]
MEEGDVNQTLGELERRLKELERELESVGRAGETGAEPAQGGWTPPPPPPPGTTPFTAAWSGGAGTDETSPPPTPNGAPPIPVRPPYWQPAAPPAAEAPSAPDPQPERAPEPEPEPEPEPAAGTPAPEPEPRPAPLEVEEPEAPAATAATEGLHRQLDELLAFRQRLVASTNELVDELSRVLTDLGVDLEAVEPEPTEPDPADTVLEGDVVVEAGPFPELVTLAAFEQELRRLDGVGRVSVRSLSEGQAIIDVALEEPTRLAAELRDRAVVAFEVAEVGEGRLVLAVDASADAPLG